jgi:probable HAF family extracellular repeat protein
MPKTTFALGAAFVTSLLLAPLSARAQTYEIRDIGGQFPGASSYVLGINNQGQTVGYWLSREGSRAFLYNNGVVTDLGLLGGTNAYALSINALGEIVGFTDTATGTEAFLYTAGVKRPLWPVPAMNSYAYGINHRSHIVGYIEAATGADGFIYNKEGEIIFIEGLGGTRTYAFGINDLNEVVGSASIPGDTRMAAFVWKDGAIVSLSDNLPLNSGWELVEARGINRFGEIVGSGFKDGREAAFLLANGQVRDLGMLEGATNSYAFGLNDSGHVVGACNMADGTAQAFLWKDGVLLRLNDMPGLQIGWDVREARAINDGGQIAGWARVGEQDHAILLTPVPGHRGGERKPTVSILAESSLPATNGPLADAYVRDGANAANNFGTATLMELKTNATSGENRDIYFKFAIDNAPTPLGSAKLRVFASLSGNGSITTTTYPVSDTNWTETGITWNNKPALGTPLTNQTFTVKLGATYDIDITPYVRSEQNAGRSIITVAFHNTNTTTLTGSVNSRENAANKPALFLNTNSPPTVSISSPANNSSFPAPTNLTINATASDSDGTVTQVLFYANTVLLGSDGTSPFSWTWTNAPLGTHALRAVASDNLGTISTSAVVNVTIATNLVAVADAHVRSDNANVAFGSLTLLEVQTNGASGPTRDSYMRFDLSGVTNISSAKIRIFSSLSGSGTGSGTYYSVADVTWDEATVTWNTRPALSNVLSHVSVSGTSGAWRTNDITAFVAGEKAAGRNLVTVALHSQTNSTRFIQFNAREATSNRVELIIGTSNTPPAVAINSPTNNSVYRAPASIQIEASASDDVSVAQVEFFNGGASLGVDTTAPYTATWDSVTSGSYALTGRATDNLGLISTSAVVNIQVDAPPSVNITSPLNGAIFTPPTNITIAAAASDSDGTVSQVEFFQGTNSLGVDSSSPFSLVWSNVATGPYPMTARATDNLGIVSTSAVVNILIDVPPAVAITSPLSGAILVAPANIPITATASDTDGIVTQVEFFQGTTSLGVKTAAPYSLTWNNISAGTYALTARAADNFGVIATSAVVNITVDIAPTVTITNPPNNSVYTPPAEITLGASAADADGSISKVEFFFGATNKIGEDTSSPYSLIWSNVPLGRYELTAKATDNLGIATVSPAIVVLSDVLPSVTITNPTTGSTFQVPSNIVVSATASDSDGSIDHVEFYAGAIYLGSVATAPYNFTWTNAQAGVFALTAQAVDNLGGGTVSAPVYITNTFTATNLAGARLWLHAAAGLTTNASGQISVWADQSGNGNNATQNTANNQPLWVANAINGRPVVRFDGVNDSFALPNFLAGTVTQAEVYVVVKATADVPATTRSLWRLGASGSGSVTYPSTAGTIGEDFGSTGLKSIGDPAQPLDQYHLYNVSARVGEWVARFNGVVQHSTTNNPTVNFWNPPTLGAASFFFSGDVAEMIIYNRPLAVQERDTISGYLQHRYGFRPPAPNNLTASNATPTSVLLRWWNLGITNALGYTIERKIGSFGQFAVLAAVLGATTNYLDDVLTADIPYIYRVRGTYAVGESDYSNEAARPIDSDGDGVSDASEAVIGSNPSNSDSDGDGLPDGWEIRYGLNPLSSSGSDGANGDPDFDGVTNLNEYLQGTDPTSQEPVGDNSIINLRVFTPLK